MTALVLLDGKTHGRGKVVSLNGKFYFPHKDCIVPQDIKMIEYRRGGYTVFEIDSKDFHVVKGKSKRVITTDNIVQYLAELENFKNLQNIDFTEGFIHKIHNNDNQSR